MKDSTPVYDIMLYIAKRYNKPLFYDRDVETSDYIMRWSYVINFDYFVIYADEFSRHRLKLNIYLRFKNTKLQLHTYRYISYHHILKTSSIRSIQFLLISLINWALTVNIKELTNEFE